VQAVSQTGQQAIILKWFPLARNQQVIILISNSSLSWHKALNCKAFSGIEFFPWSLHCK